MTTLTNDQIKKFAEINSRIGLCSRNGQIMIRNGEAYTADDKATLAADRDGMVEFVRWMESDYADYIQTVTALNKPESIKGYDELVSLISAWSSYNNAALRAINSQGAWSEAVAKPETAVDEMKAQYPAAAALLHAESYANADDSRKAAAGNKAVKAIKETPDNHEAIISTMEAEWAAVAHDAVWND